MKLVYRMSHGIDYILIKFKTCTAFANNPIEKLDEIKCCNPQYIPPHRSASHNC